MSRTAKALALGLAAGLAGAAAAREPERILVTGVVPAGSSLDRDKLPYPLQTASAETIDRMGAASLAGFMRRRFGGVSANDAQGNPLQPDLLYRGFTASPLLGLAQGVAVYQNGARVNEPLGDTVNWDLLPQTAIERVALGGGANPLFGLNALGGALSIDMKDGFSFDGAAAELSGGAFGRVSAGAEFGGGGGRLAWYASIERFSEDGWRDHSPSEAANLYGSLGWRVAGGRARLNHQRGRSDLTGNGASPVELLALRREAVFTGPDVTENDMRMTSLDFSREAETGAGFSGNLFHRRNDARSFNGDGGEFAVCGFAGGDGLVEGLEDDDLDALGLDEDDVCGGRFAGADALEDFLNAAAMDAGLDERFRIEGFRDDELSGSGVLSDAAVNNISARSQRSLGADLQWTLPGGMLGFSGQLVLGGAWFRGDSAFDAALELSDIDPATRMTAGLGAGTYVGEGAAAVDTRTESASAYFSATADVSDRVALTLSARGNRTSVSLADRSGARPELDGSHRFSRVNPAAGATWRVAPGHSLYASVGASSRAPTPIELACNEGVFELARRFAAEAGEDPEDIDFECRLPNAFLADPPLEDVTAVGVELGARGRAGATAYSAGFFRTVNRNDILFQTTGRSTGLFANVDKTRRAGFEASLSGRLGALEWFAAYSLVEAVFADRFTALSPNHAFADEEGGILVERGDRIPGVPRRQFKLVADWRATRSLALGLDVVSNGGRTLRGDESNQLDGVDGYTAVGLRARYRLGGRFEAFALVSNVFDARYETFGLLGEDPGELALPVVEDLSAPVFLGPAPPRAAFVGLRLRL